MRVCVRVCACVCVCVRARVCLPVACTRPLTLFSVCLHAITPTLAVALALSLSLAFALALVCLGVRTSSPRCRKGSERYSIKHKQYLRVSIEPGFLTSSSPTFPNPLTPKKGAADALLSSVTASSKQRDKINIEGEREIQCVCGCV